MLRRRNVVRAAVEWGLLVLRSIRVNVEPKFSGNHHVFAQRGKCFADEFFIGEPSVNFCGVEKRDSAFDGRANQRNHFLFVFRWTKPKAHPHTTESNRRYLKPAVP